MDDDAVCGCCDEARAATAVSTPRHRKVPQAIPFELSVSNSFIRKAGSVHLWFVPELCHRHYACILRVIEGGRA